MGFPFGRQTEENTDGKRKRKVGKYSSLTVACIILWVKEVGVNNIFEKVSLKIFYSSVIWFAFQRVRILFALLGFEPVTSERTINKFIIMMFLILDSFANNAIKYAVIKKITISVLWKRNWFMKRLHKKNHIVQKLWSKVIDSTRDYSWPSNRRVNKTPRTCQTGWEFPLAKGSRRRKSTRDSIRGDLGRKKRKRGKAGKARRIGSNKT